MIVADSSVIAPALLDAGSSGALAREVLRTGSEVHVPYLVDVEVLSIVRGYTRSGRLQPAEAEDVLADLDALALTRYPHLGLLPGAWRLRANVTAYDAMYVALAEMVGAKLVTADSRLSRVPGLRCEVEVLDALGN